MINIPVFKYLCVLLKIYELCNYRFNPDAEGHEYLQQLSETDAQNLIIKIDIFLL